MIYQMGEVVTGPQAPTDTDRKILLGVCVLLVTAMFAVQHFHAAPRKRARA